MLANARAAAAERKPITMIARSDWPALRGRADAALSSSVGARKRCRACDYVARDIRGRHRYARGVAMARLA